MTRLRFVPMAALFCVAAHTIASAQQHPRRAVAELDHTVWTARDGAPSAIQALAQSVDGTLWLGTSSGLYEFDGKTFLPFEAPNDAVLPTVSVSALLARKNADLWIGYTAGGVSLVTRDGVTNYAERDGLPGGTVTSIALDSTAHVWIATTTGLARLGEGRWDRVVPDRGYPGGMTSDLVVDRRGTLWVAGQSGVFTLDRGGSQFLKRAPSLDPTAGGSGLPRMAPDGSVWGSSVPLGLTRLSDSAGRSVEMRQAAGALHTAWGLGIDSHANAWLWGPAGLVRVSLPTQAEERTTVSDLSVSKVSLTANEVLSILEDREENVWVGTVAGLERYRETKLIPVVFPRPINKPAIVARDDGSIWAGVFGPAALFAVADDGPRLSGSHDISAAYRDLNGGTWLGGPTGLWYAARNDGSRTDRFSSVVLPDGVSSVQVQGIAQSVDGDLWLSLRGANVRGTFRRRGSRWSTFEPAGLPDGFARIIVADSAGRTWFGYAQNRIVVATHDSTRVYSDRDGIDVGAVTALYVHGQNVWIGGESGIMAFDGVRFRRIKSGAALRGITGIVETANGDLWLNGAGGVTHIPSKELARAKSDTTYHVDAERFDYHDGLDGQAPQVRPVPTLIQGTDGRLWFATESGISWTDPVHLRRNALPPPVHVRTVIADGRRYPTSTSISFPAGTSDLQIAYTAGSLSMPDRVRFRYRLTGTDTAWQEPGGRREAFYTNLKPGSYHFQVIAANEDGVWNESGASVFFDIPPTFVQSRWFLAVWAALLGATAWLIYHLRLRQMAARLRTQYEATLTERTRIAQELHDTLLQGFTGITMHLRAIQRLLIRRPEEVTAAIDAVVTSASTALRDARNTIWDMHAAELAHQDLPEALESATRAVLNGTEIVFEFSLKGEPRRLPPRLETTALRVGREAVVNVLKHADAKHVRVVLQYESERLQLEIRDDGSGMASGASESAVASGHLGIAGMHARAESVRGSVKIVSAPGKGTVVSLSLPTTA